MKKRKVKIKIKRPKRRVPVAPPGFPHKDQKKYDRERDKKRIERVIEDLKRVPLGRPGEFVHVPGVCHMYVPVISKQIVVTGSLVGLEAFGYAPSGPWKCK